MGEHFRYPWIDRSRQLRDHFEAETVSSVFQILVRAVLSPCDFALYHPLPNFCPPDFDKRTDQAGAGRHANSTQAAGSGSPEKAVQHRFGLVIERMARGDGIAGVATQLFLEERITNRAGFLFHIARPQSPTEGSERQFETGRQIGHEIFIRARFSAPQFVVNVQDDRGETELVKRVKKEDRIRAAGHCHTNAPAALQKLITLKGIGHAIDHASILRVIGITLLQLIRGEPVPELVKEDVRSRAAKIRLLLMDVDGVLTNGHIYHFPDSMGKMVETKGFDSQDGLALRWLRDNGIKTGVISGRDSPATVERARQLDMNYVYQGHLDKIPILEQIMTDAKVTADQIAYAGDDMTDLIVMRRVGLAIAVANARPEVKKAAHYVTQRAGGNSAIRESIEIILEAQGLWAGILARYQA